MIMSHLLPFAETMSPDFRDLFLRMFSKNYTELYCPVLLSRSPEGLRFVDLPSLDIITILSFGILDTCSFHYLLRRLTHLTTSRNEVRVMILNIFIAVSCVSSDYIVFLFVVFARVSTAYVIMGRIHDL